MTEDIIIRNNSVVSDNDDVWDLGDVAFRCRPEEVADSLKRLNGRRHIILGNHDKALRQAYIKGLLKDLIKSGKLEIIGGETAIYDSSLAVSKMLKIDGQNIFMSHYACRTWPSAFRGTIHLFGHSHSNLPECEKSRSFDVGVDAWNFYPVSFRMVMAKIKDIDEGNSLKHKKPNDQFEDGTKLFHKDIKEFNLRYFGI
ncbi:MAG: hypothetical protein WC119_04535 [Synergistaceae bacterium]